ncbi:MAG TPA: aspartyl protease family protein [Thermoplasmata archaeon]|nr:aspartyl protease family protein [Thermoplasmata archaeon]
MEEIVRFERVAGHLAAVPVQLGPSIETRFVLDTGIGLNLISSALATRIGARRTGAIHTGQRMSGQAVSVPLVTIPRLSMGPHHRDHVPAGILDLAGLSAQFGVDGFLSLQFFESTAFTIGGPGRTIYLPQRTPAGPGTAASFEVPIRIDRDGPSVSAFTDLRLPNGRRASVEIDSGSDSLILNARFLADLGLRADAEGVRTVQGTDETGYAYTRRFARIPDPVSLWDAPSISQRDLDVMFQEIMYDGLLGDAFLRRYDVTYDVPRSRVTFAEAP